MAKGTIAKLAKLKFMLKRWRAASVSRRRNATDRLISSPDSSEDDVAIDVPTSPHVCADNEVPEGMTAVYVGKSRRRYLISERLIDHPLIRVLVQEDEDATVVGCEVVLFEHLLWMLENGDPPAESLDELAEFYAC